MLCNITSIRKKNYRNLGELHVCSGGELEERCYWEICHLSWTWKICSPKSCSQTPYPLNGDLFSSFRRKEGGVCMEMSEDRAMGRYGSLCLPHLLFWCLLTIIDSNDWLTYQDWVWWQLSQWWGKEIQMFPILLKPNNWFIGYPFLVYLEDSLKWCAPSGLNEMGYIFYLFKCNSVLISFYIIIKFKNKHTDKSVFWERS